MCGLPVAAAGQQAASVYAAESKWLSLRGISLPPPPPAPAPHQKLVSSSLAERHPVSST